MKTYRVLVFPKTGFSFYVLVPAINRGDALCQVRSMYPDLVVGPVEEA